jgi:hypothetical protein
MATKPSLTISDMINIVKGSTSDYNNSQLILVVLFVIMILSLFYSSSNVGVSESQSYAAIISVAMIIVSIALFKLSTDKSNIYARGAAISCIIIFIFGGIIVEFYKNYIKRSVIFDRSSRDPTTRVVFNIIEISLVISIIVVGISFAQNTIGRYLNNSTDWFGFILNLIVYIPCLFEDLIVYLKQQYNLTPSVTFILLGIETALIAIYVLLPKIFNSKLVDDTIQIINDPVFLDIPVTQTFVNQDDGDRKAKRANYAISMWVYLNQQNNITKTTNIFSYRKSYLTIEYVKSNNNIKDKYRFTLNGNKKYDIDVSNQKWNNIVLNFNENKTVDVFINGNLERTFSDSDARNPSLNAAVNTITIGSPGGLYGAICNIKYYEIPLTNTQIVQNYNLLYNKNPPVNKIM